MIFFPTLPAKAAGSIYPPRPDRAKFAGTLVRTQSSYPDDHPAGGELDFERLVNLQYGPLYRFAMSLTHRESDACDLVQETFRIWAIKGRQLQDASKVKAWLFTTLHRLFLDAHRRETRFPQLEISTVADELPNVDPDRVSGVDAAGLLTFLAQLDPPFRSAVALFYLEDYSYAEVAEILGTPLGTVKSRIARGLTQLKQLYLRDHPRSADPRGDNP